MKLIEALELVNRPFEAAVNAKIEASAYFLACGFEPLHLKTFLAAHLRQRGVARPVVEAGVFGDLAGNLGRASKAGVLGCAVVMEWPDLDPRLGLREPASWLPETLPDIAASSRAALGRLEGGLNELAGVTQVAVSLPALPFPPLVPARSVSAFELEIRSLVAQFAARVALPGRVRVLRQAVSASPADIRADLLNGFPYTPAHADELAAGVSALLVPEPVKKGIITDLDDTFWKGIVGDAGPGGVAWDLAGKGRPHGLYQQFLRALAARGVLVAVASKNDAAVVKQAFSRPDILMPADQFYPLAVHWRPKSESVADILKVWNVDPDSVVFVDDNPMELAEVKAAHPAVETLQFPKDPGKLPQLLQQLGQWFGKETILQEDVLRAGSIRAGEAWREAGSGPNDAFEEFLAQAGATLTIHIGPSQELGRPFDLVNKTNQFNLNGKRYSEAEWLRFLSQENALLATIAYEDKFGPLGIISVALVLREPDSLVLPAWVLSCRAFARRIEHQFIASLFSCNPEAKSILLDYRETERNGLAGEFVQGLSPAGIPPRVTRQAFTAACPALHHIVQVNTNE